MREVLLTNKTRRPRVLLAVLTIGVVCAMTGCSSDDNSAPGDEPTTTSVVAASTTPPPLTAATTSETVEGSNSVGGGTDASTPGVPAGRSSAGLDPGLDQRGCPCGPWSGYRVDQVHRSDQLCG